MGATDSPPDPRLHSSPEKAHVAADSDSAEQSQLLPDPCPPSSSPTTSLMRPPHQRSHSVDLTPTEGFDARTPSTGLYTDRALGLCTPQAGSRSPDGEAEGELPTFRTPRSVGSVYSGAGVGLRGSPWGSPVVSATMSHSHWCVPVTNSIASKTNVALAQSLSSGEESGQLQNAVMTEIVWNMTI